MKKTTVKKIFYTTAMAIIFLSGAAIASDKQAKEEMIIKRREAQESIEGPAEYFTSKVPIDPIHLKVKERRAVGYCYMFARLRCQKQLAEPHLSFAEFED